MGKQRPVRNFEFYPHEDRALLSGEGPDGADLAPNAGEDVSASMLAEMADADAAAQVSAGGTQPSVETPESFDVADALAIDPARPFEVVIVDAGVEDAQTLIDGLRSDSGDDTQWYVIELSATEDGIEQITQSLEQLSGVGAIHLISHGDGQGIVLGDTRLDVETAPNYAGEIASWGYALDSQADLLIYGCDLTSTIEGQDLIEMLAIVCNCDVGASDDATGNAALGGDWDLEYNVGVIDSSVAFNSAAQSQWEFILATYKVTNTLDGGSSGSLRWAIDQSNLSTTVEDTIDFAITAAGVHTIALDSALPSITDDVILDATTQAGGSFTTPLIELVKSGSYSAGDTAGIVVRANNTTVSGFIVHGFADEGIGVDGSTTFGDNNIIEHNWIGLTAAGAASGNLGDEILITENADNNIVRNNIVGANSGGEIVIRNTDGENNWVYSNTIGLGIDGVTERGNSGYGAHIYGGDNNTTGTDGNGTNDANEGNTISGNSSGGIYVTGFETDSNIIAGNPIGTDTTGTVLIGNSGNNVNINQDASDTIGGGIDALEGNAIAGGADGTTSFSSSTTGTTVQGNYIGTDTTGTLDWANSGSGVVVGGDADETLEGSDNPNWGNVIALNKFGVAVWDWNADKNAILGNSIDRNDRLDIEIEIAGVGVNPNDNNDADTGANEGQNYPVFTTVSHSLSSTTVNFDLNTNQAGNDRIELYVSDVADAMGYGEGQTLVHSEVINHSGGGHESFAVVVAMSYNAIISATATEDCGSGNYGSTAELSAVRTVQGGGVLVVDTTSDVSDGNTSSTANLLGNRGRDGKISLREAIEAANAIVGTFDIIQFEILDPLVDGAHTINVGSWAGAGLKLIDDAVIIDATTDSDFAGNPVIEISGPVAVGADGFRLLGSAGDSSTIRGFIINQFDEGVVVADSDNTLVVGNWIGTDSTGSADQGNTGIGIEILDSENTVSGNSIGVAADGYGALGNTVYGILIDRLCSGNLIGGAGASEGNTIANHGGNGISVFDNNAIGNSILGNSIHTNTGLGVDLGTSDVTNNDAKDSDAGPNGLQSFPVLTQADLSGNNLTASGSLDTDGLTTQYQIDFFGNAAGTQDATNGEGRVYLGTHAVTTNGGGDGTFSGIVLSGTTLSVGDFVTATATKIDTTGMVGIDDLAADGSTSEFAANVAIAKLNQAPEIAAWFDNDRTYRKEIFVSAGPVSGKLVGLPILVDLNTGIDLASFAQADGDDILCASADGVTQLAHESEVFASVRGELTVVVKTDLSDAQDTRLYMSYGNAAAANQQDAVNVWDAGYQGVWHLSNSPAGAAGEIVDSTSNNNDGVIKGSMDAADLVDTKIGKGLDFDEVDDLIRVSDSASLDSTAAAATFEVWVWFDEANGTWQYDSGGGRTDFGTVNDNGAVLLDATAKVRFVTNANYNGTSGDLTFRVWGQADALPSGATGVNVSTNGGTSAYSSTTDSATLNVLPVNDAPTAVDDNAGLGFDGIDDLVNFGSGPALKMTNTMTMEVSIRPNKYPGAGSVFLNKEGEYELGISFSGNLRWAFENTDPGWAWHDTSHARALNAWAHVAVKYDPGIVTTYANGNVDDIYNGSGSIGDANATIDDLVVDGRTNKPANQYFDGQSDEVRIWNTVRTESEIVANAGDSLVGNEAGLAGYWQFNEGSGTMTDDLTTNNNDGTLDLGANATGLQLTQFTIDEDNMLNHGAAGGLLHDDFDQDGDSISVTEVEGGAANVGSFVVSGSTARVRTFADGSFDYDPNSRFDDLATGETATDSWTYTIDDGDGGVDVATATVYITGVNDAPLSTSGPDAVSLTEIDVGLTSTGTLTYTVSASNEDGTPLSDTETVTATITGTDDVPQVAASSTSLKYTEQAAAVVVDGAPTLTDIDGGDTTSAVVGISEGLVAGDSLNLVDQLGIAASYDAGFGILTLTGPASAADYQTALPTITFDSTSDDPGPLRVATFVLDNRTETGDTVSRSTVLSAGFEVDAVSFTYVEIDGIRYGYDTNASLVHSFGDENGGGTDDTGWLNDEVQLHLAAGNHTFEIGAYNNKATAADKCVEVFIDNFLITQMDDARTIKIREVNDAPVIIGRPDISGFTETDVGLIASGTLTVSDPDTADLVTAAVDSVAANGTGAASVPGTLTNAILQSFLTVSPTAILDGTETTDTLTWAFNSGGEAFDCLVTGETLVLTYTVIETADAPSTTQVTITIQAQNDTPDAVADAATAVGALRTAADTLSEVFSYTMVDSDLTDNAGGRFTIDTNSGIVEVVGGLDFETNSSHTITVLAQSDDGSSASGSFLIQVNDVNEVPADDYSITAATTLNVNIPGGLGNDNDVDGDGLTAVIATLPSHRCVALATLLFPRLNRVPASRLRWTLCGNES